MICTIKIEGTEIKAKKGSNVLYTALDHGFYIPNLCSIRDNPKPFASCRLCFVEISGQPGPVTACTQRAVDGMEITLRSPSIHRMRKTSFDLLMSNHRLNCSHCLKNKRCDLQKIAKFDHFKLEDNRFKKMDFDIPIDSSHPLFSLDISKCVLCGKCIWVCRKEGSGALDFAYRGVKTRVSTFGGMPLADACHNPCLACVAACPVSALYFKKPVSEAAGVRTIE
jgi:bidirectional [NiFe] hydrogenase diaphorase subunit